MIGIAVRAGRPRIATLLDGERTAGRHEATWAAGAQAGVAPGIYYARLGFAGRIADRRVVLLP